MTHFHQYITDHVKSIFWIGLGVLALAAIFWGGPKSDK